MKLKILIYVISMNDFVQMSMDLNYIMIIKMMIWVWMNYCKENMVKIFKQVNSETRQMVIVTRETSLVSP